LKTPGILFFLIFILFHSCVSGQKENSTIENDENIMEIDDEIDYISQLEQSIVGEWANISMKVLVKTYNNSDTSFIVDITEETWEMKMNIKPIVTIIREDGTYISEFRNSFDSLIYRPEGTWLIDGDTLIMEDHQAVYKYQIFIDGDMAEFKNMIDWDNDGNVDDEYSGVQRKNN
jgi:hypothetical protein